MTARWQTSEPALSDYLRVVRRRINVVVVVVVLAGGVALALSVTQTRLYRGTARVLLQPAEAERVFESPAAGRLSDPARVLQTELDLIKHLPRPAAIRRLQGRITGISAAGSENTDIIKVSATAEDPALAAAAANAYAEAYVDLRRQRTVDSLQGAARQLESKIAELDAQIAASNGAGALAPDQQRLQLLVARQSALREKLDEVLVESTLTTGGVQLAAPATEPTSPVSPQPVRDAALATGLGLVLGLGLAFVLDHLDDRIKAREDLDALIGDRFVLATVPVGPRSPRRDPTPVMLSHPDDPAAEACRSLRTSLQFLGAGERLRVLQVTSPNLGEGKTTILANLAVAFAQTGAEVVVVCCDLRRPFVNRLFGLDNSLGLTSILTGDADLERCLQRVRGDVPLSLLASGPLPPNPSELLSGPAAAALFAELRERGNIILVDSPPLLPVADASVVVRHVDATLLVASAGTTRRRHVVRSQEILEQIGASVVGVTLNRAGSGESYGKYQYYAREDVRPRRQHQAGA